MAAVTVPELSRINWHRLGALGSLVSQAMMGLAAISVQPGFRTLGWFWYFGTFGGIAVIYVVVRRHPSPSWWLVWPIACLVRLGSFGLVDHRAAQLVTGLIFVFFLFAGLTQPRGRSLYLLPLALVVLRGLIDLPLNLALIRLSIAAASWAMASELPALLLGRLSEQQRTLSTIAATDSLTGARNRHGLDQLLTTMQGRAYLVIVDLDQFKRYNDRFGHLAGDKVLVDFASMLMLESRSSDFVIRYGGEEFLILLVDVDQRRAERVVDRWAESWRAHPSGITFSAGVTDLRGDQAMRRADTSLYEAKESGRARTVVSLSGVGGN